MSIIVTVEVGTWSIHDQSGRWNILGFQDCGRMNLSYVCTYMACSQLFTLLFILDMRDLISLLLMTDKKKNVNF